MVARPKATQQTALARALDNRGVLGALFMLPAAALLLLFLTYPLGPRHLSRLHRRQDRPRRAVGRPREFRVPVGRRRHAARAVQHALLYDRRQRHQVRARPLARAAAQQAPPVQGGLAGGRAAAVHRADGAVGDRVLVDLRFAVLDHQLGAAEARPHQRVHRFPRPALARALLDDRRQHLARRAVRRHHAAGRIADDLAVVLRGGEPRRRVAVAAVPLRDAAAADADHRRRDDVLGADHVHRLPADLRADARRAAQFDAPDGHAVVPARDLGRQPGRGRGDRDGDGAVPAGGRSCSATSACSAARGSRAGRTNERRGIR